MTHAPDREAFNIDDLHVCRPWSAGTAQHNGQRGDLRASVHMGEVVAHIRQEGLDEVARIRAVGLVWMRWHAYGQRGSCGW